jgi:prepilin-type N-terminal cleavage/methylation domain-containing protein
MKRHRRKQWQAGFTLIELLTALGIFLIVCGAAFTLLGASQQRAKTESQVLTSFQEARLALDQIVRDVNDAGYPPPSYSDGVPYHFASTPFAWSPNYTSSSPCAIGIDCISPADFDIIIETNPNPLDPSCTPNCPVKWIRYKLDTTTSTLMRGAVDKQTGHDPDADTAANLAPLVQNVVNNASAAQIAQYQAIYTGMFPGGNPVPIFSYTCDTPTAPQPPPCPSAGADNIPANIRDVTVTLIVAAPVPDATTGQPRLVQLVGRGRRVNPNQ